MIRVSVEGRPDLSPFELEPPQTAETVVEVVSGELEVETGILKAGRHLYVGNATVPPGEYVFKAKAAQPKGR